MNKKIVSFKTAVWLNIYYLGIEYPLPNDGLFYMPIGSPTIFIDRPDNHN